MQPETSTAIRAIWEKVHAPAGLPFPQTVGQLAALGVTRYRIDYIASTATAYVGNEADVAPIPRHAAAEAEPIPTAWDAEALVAAIRGAQAGTIGNYHDFSRAAIAAGVTDYTTFLAGKKVVYFGALGDGHTEWFPGAKKD
jgi:uncharacterized protein YbcV (DUF1398 family)